MDELELTRRAFGDPGEDPEARERIRARLREAIRDERPPRRRSALLAAAIAAAVGLVAIAVVFALVPLGGGPAAAAELRRLGALAADAEGPAIGAGEFVLTPSEELRPEIRTDLEAGVSFTVRSRLRLGTWIAADGSGVRRTEVLSTDFASDADREAWIEAGRPEVPEAGEVRIERYPPGEGPWVDLSRVSRQPGPLLESLRSGQVMPHVPGDDQVFILVGELLAQGDAPQELRSALFEVAARLDGVELVGEVADPLGRAGVGLAVGGTRSRTQLLFDPETSHLLAIEEYAVRADGSVASLSSWRAYRPATVDDAPPEPHTSA